MKLNAFSAATGLDHHTDFDGSFWTPINPDAPRDPPRFFYSEDEGTMTLISRQRAVYTSSSGVQVDLHRHHGPLLLKGACA
ncbi:MAG: hypothetical protein ABR529_10500 [Actinomycetota bacterium]